MTVDYSITACMVTNVTHTHELLTGLDSPKALEAGPPNCTQGVLLEGPAMSTSSALPCFTSALNQSGRVGKCLAAGQCQTQQVLIMNIVFGHAVAHTIHIAEDGGLQLANPRMAVTLMTCRNRNTMHA